MTSTAAQPWFQGRFGEGALPRSGDEDLQRPAAIDVVIITWNDSPAALASAISSAQCSQGVIPNVTVVDNGSVPPACVPDGVTLMRNSANLGVAKAHNQGIRAGTAPLVCILDSDPQLLPDTLGALARRIRDGVVLAAPVFVGQVPEESAGRSPGLLRKLIRGLTRRYAPTRRRSRADTWAAEFAIGACQLFARAAWAAVWGLDETYLYGPEDIDFCDRLRRHGDIIVQTSAGRCIHPHAPRADDRSRPERCFPWWRPEAEIAVLSRIGHGPGVECRATRALD